MDKINEFVKSKDLANSHRIMPDAPYPKPRQFPRQNRKYEGSPPPPTGLAVLRCGAKIGAKSSPKYAHRRMMCDVTADGHTWSICACQRSHRSV